MARTSVSLISSSLVGVVVRDMGMPSVGVDFQSAHRDGPVAEIDHTSGCSTT
jgi:hypothetical protein